MAEVSDKEWRRIKADADRRFPLPEKTVAQRFLTTSVGVWMVLIAYQVVTDEFVSVFEAFVAIALAALAGGVHAADKKRAWDSHFRFVDEEARRIREREDR